MRMLDVNHVTTKSYKTIDNAAKSIEDIELELKESFLVIMVTNNEGRFVPVVLMSEKQVVYMLSLAMKGFHVVRT